MKLIHGAFLSLGVLAALAYSTPSQAGCGMEITFENQNDSSITILEVESKISVGGTYATVWTSDFNVGAHSNATKAIELKMACATAPRTFRVKYRKGSSPDSHFEEKGPVVTAVDHKITIVFK